MRRTVERELKLTPTEGFDLSGLGGVQLPNRDFVSTYFDTAELLLAQAGITLRHRAEGGARLWQLKVPSGAASNRARGRRRAGPPAGRASRIARRPPSRREAGAGRATANAAKDRTHARRGDRGGLRGRAGRPAGEDAISRARSRARGFVRRASARSSRESIAARRRGADRVPTEGLSRTRPRASRQKRHRSLPDATALEVLTAALYEQRGRLLDHDPGTRLGTDPEDLHQMRVATRRARAFLRVARPLLDPGWTDELRTELGWLGSALGPARDLDVLVARMQGEISRLGDDGAGARGLLTSFERQRRERSRRRWRR